MAGNRKHYHGIERIGGGGGGGQLLCACMRFAVDFVLCGRWWMRWKWEFGMGEANPVADGLCQGARKELPRSCCPSRKRTIITSLILCASLCRTYNMI